MHGFLIPPKLPVASSNLSKGGLVSNHEANLMIKGKASDKPIIDALEYFSDLQSESYLLDEHAIELYRKKKQKLDEAVSETINDEEILESGNELIEYLNSTISDEDDKLSEHDKNLICFFNEKLEAADLLFINGDIYDAIELIKEASNELNSFDEPNSIHIMHSKFNYNLSLAIFYDSIGEIKEAKPHANKAKDIGKSIFEVFGETSSYVQGLIGSADFETSDKEIDKYNEFINFHVTNLEEIDREIEELKNTAELGDIGNAYHSASILKYNNEDYDSSINYIKMSQSYLQKYLKYSEESYSSMMAHKYLAHLHYTKDIYNRTKGKNKKLINDHYHEALRIAKNELNSKFWEGFMLLQIAEYDEIHEENKKKYLKGAEKIFKELGYKELVKRVHESLNDMKPR